MTSVIGCKIVDNSKVEGWYLEHLTWQQGEPLLIKNKPVVIPLGASAKEHGPHLPLNSDAIIAEWLASEVVSRLPIVVAPNINCSFYPAFSDYPGSISMSLSTATNMVIDICKSLAAFGADRFYILNTGVSTEKPLSEARERLDEENLTLEYLHLSQALKRIPEGVLTQGWGSHADEHKTSLILHIAPEVVNMEAAVDDGSEGEGMLSRTRGTGTWSESGVFGQARLASVEKGELVAQALIDEAINDIEKMMSVGA
jgi:creatinine amidohydrolase